MESYFEPSDPFDLDLLRSDVQDDTEMVRVARAAEADCIEWYTERIPLYPTGRRTGYQSHREKLSFRASRVHPDAVKIEEGVYVFLRGYAEDAAEADGYAAERKDWTGFAKAFRRAIARVVEHRLRYRNEDPTVTSETRGRRSQTREAGVLNPRYPKHWNRSLSRYDVRTGAHHI